MTNEEYPRIMYTRRPPKSAAVGTIPKCGSGQTSDAALEALYIRDCKELLPQGCLSMHIGLCAGPCIDGQGYDVEGAVRRVLNGDAAPLLEELRTEMEAAADAQAYEAAAQHRDMIGRSAPPPVNTWFPAKSTDCDAIGIAHEGDLAALVVLHADEGGRSTRAGLPCIGGPR